MSASLLVADVALLHHVFERLTNDDVRVALSTPLSYGDLRQIGFDVTSDMGVAGPWAADYSLRWHRPVPAELTAGLVLSAFDPWDTRGLPQQLAVASRTDAGPSTFWWSVDGVTVYEA